nr:dienelactone hydrolase family protein [Verrucomicrobiota bacterium]
DYGYAVEGRRRPDPLLQLVTAHRAALAAIRNEDAGSVVLIGKSMGSRVGCHVSLEENVSALVCLGYPLCGGGDAAKLRDKVLREIRTAILFIQGTRDPLCPLELLAKVRAQMAAPNELYVVEGGDHSLAVTKRQLTAAGETQDEVDARILEVIGVFLRRHTEGDTPRRSRAATADVATALGRRSDT